jgi:hypothetical protein
MIVNVLAAFGMLFLCAIGLAATWIATTIARYWVISRYSDQFMVVTLFDAMKELEGAGEKWTDVDLRSLVATRISTASVIARRFLFRKFEVADVSFLRWKTHQANSVADALSEKQRWLMTPKSDTRGFLLTSLSRSIVALLSGAWDDLEKKEPAEVSDMQDQVVSRWRKTESVLLSSFRTFSVAVLPVGVFLLGRSFGLLSDLDSQVLVYTEIGLFVWVMLIIAFTLDPQLKDKISSGKDIITLLNPLTKKP